MDHGCNVCSTLRLPSYAATDLTARDTGISNTSTASSTTTFLLS